MVFHFLNLAVALEQVLAENVCREILINVATSVIEYGLL